MRRASVDRAPIDKVVFSGGLLVAATIALYVWVISEQGPPHEWGKVAAYAVIFAIPALAAMAIAASGDFRGRRPALVATGTALATLGVIGIFSVGLPLLVAAGLVFAGLGRRLIADPA